MKGYLTITIMPPLYFIHSFMGAYERLRTPSEEP